MTFIYCWCLLLEPDLVLKSCLTLIGSVCFPIPDVAPTIQLPWSSRSLVLPTCPWCPSAPAIIDETDRLLVEEVFGILDVAKAATPQPETLFFFSFALRVSPWWNFSIFYIFAFVGYFYDGPMASSETCKSTVEELELFHNDFSSLDSLATSLSYFFSRYNILYYPLDTFSSRSVILVDFSS